MVKYLAMALLVLHPVVSVAQEQPSFGFSNSVIEPAPLPEARQKLERQGQSGGPKESELSVQTYVDSQTRMAETFRRPVPDRERERMRSDSEH